MSIYDDIVRSQVKMGYMGGRNGPLGHYANKKEKKFNPDQEYGKKEKYVFKVTIHSGNVFKSTDSNGLSDPFIRIKKNNILGSTLLETPVQEKTLTPNWEYTAEFELDKRQSKGTSVVFELLDKDLIGSDKVGLCKVTLNERGTKEKIEFKSVEDGRTFLNGNVTFSYAGVKK